jgi:hypothetical protein
VAHASRVLFFSRNSRTAKKEHAGRVRPQAARVSIKGVLRVASYSFVAYTPAAYDCPIV